jgi:hypothetical protein
MSAPVDVLAKTTGPDNSPSCLPACTAFCCRFAPPCRLKTLTPTACARCCHQLPRRCMQPCLTDTGQCSCCSGALSCTQLTSQQSVYSAKSPSLHTPLLPLLTTPPMHCLTELYCTAAGCTCTVPPAWAALLRSVLPGCTGTARTSHSTRPTGT